jgi:hypothetical protein
VAARLTNELRFEIRQPDMVGPAIGVDHDRMRAFVIGAVDEKRSGARRDGAPAKTLRRNVLELTTSRPPTCKIVGENRSRPRPDETSVREMDAYVLWKISLLRRRNSLFGRIISLLTFVGNCPGSGCSTAVSCYDSGLWRREISKFPVKFPVSREFPWRRVRSPLRRQAGRQK